MRKIIQAEFTFNGRRWLALLEARSVVVREFVVFGDRDFLLAHSVGIWYPRLGVRDLEGWSEEEPAPPGLAEAATMALRTRAERASWLEGGRVRDPGLLGLGIEPHTFNPFSEYQDLGTVVATRPAPSGEESHGQAV